MGLALPTQKLDDDTDSGGMTMNLEPVQLDCVLGDPLLGQEGGDLKPLVTLELDDLSHLFVVDECAVTGEFLFR